jgi:peptidoglycan/xylan/chitin deacetylase (PgdA/CDA1 family)
MSAKHRLKTWLREAYARVLFHTGLHALVDRIAPARLTILAGHCVRPASGDWPAGAHLPPDMAISEARLERILRWFSRRYRMVTVGEGAAALGNGLGRRSLVALSLDDGYRDNSRVLPALLARSGARATVYLESRPLDERRVNWSHKYFWILARSGPYDFVHRFGELSSDRAAFHSLNTLVAEDRVDPRYHLKRVLKYEAEPRERDRVVDAIFAELGGDERALCDQLYMTWDEARELARAEVELGGHTAGHPILSRLPPDEQQREVEQGAAAMRRELGREPESFAYPWGRRWDFDRASADSARRARFKSAVTMHAGVNLRSTDRYALKRLAIDDDAALHLLAAEACGGFELLRRLGLDLVE